MSKIKELKLKSRIKELEDENIRLRNDVQLFKDRRDSADRMIENIRCALLDPDYVLDGAYSKANARAIFVAIRRLHAAAKS